jgi:tetratricopeptide (TPR) repeat protein
LVGGGGRIRPSQRLKVFLNLSKTYYALGNYESARNYYETARTLDEDEVSRFSYLGSGSTGTARASEAASAEPIFFFEE